MALRTGCADLAALTPGEGAGICLVSGAGPLLGNLTLGLFVDRGRRLLASPRARRRMNIGAGVALIGVAAVSATG